MSEGKTEHSESNDRSSREALVWPMLTDITTSTSFQRISGMLKSTDSASCKPTSDSYAESFAQSESHALSTNLP